MTDVAPEFMHNLDFLPTTYRKKRIYCSERYKEDLAVCQITRQDGTKLCSCIENSDASWYVSLEPVFFWSIGHDSIKRSLATIWNTPLTFLGFTNTGAIFRAKTRALEKTICKAFPKSQLVYIDGPHRLRPSEIPSYPGQEKPDPRSQEPDDTEVDSFAWWKRKDPAPNSNDPITYAGIEDGLRRISETIRTQGPFDGVIGFSQGACAAGIVTALLEPGRHEAMEKARSADSRKMPYPDSFIGESGQGPVQAPLKFAIIYSGFCAPPDVYGAIYDPKLTTPILNVIGSLDTIVDEERSRVLAERQENGSVLVHPGGHFCPSTRDHLDGVTGFIVGIIRGKNGSDGPSRGLDDEKAEDMDMPF